MPRRIEEDHKDFLDIYAGRIRKSLKKFIKNGSIFRTRGDGSKIRITIPRIDIPNIVFGGSDKGVGRGKGKDGETIGKDKPEGQGQGAGTEEMDGMEIQIDMEEVFKFMKQELQLPDLKPKPNPTYEDVKIKYNDISLQGPESLRHNRRTMLQAMKRMAAAGELEKLHQIPGFAHPVRLITPINSDRRYRQYREERIQASNAVIFFARDGSGSMDQYKCDIVSDMAWWIDVWIRRFYKRVERCYVWHDTVAQEVDANKFYKYRYGGGTFCSSAMEMIAKQFDNRYPPAIWNVYVLYFSDGENWDEDNEKFNEVIHKHFPPNVVNMVGITQILCWNYQGSLKESVDTFGHAENIRTTSIGPEKQIDLSAGIGHQFYNVPVLGEEERNEQIRKAIITLLGTQEAKKEVAETEPGVVVSSKP